MSKALLDTAAPSTLALPRAPIKPLVLTAICLGQFMIQLDLTVVNVAIPDIGTGTDLGVSTAELQWVVDGCNLAVASLLLFGGRLGDRAGQ
jgi:DHA2 family methylenomycin A resistance protein-like MFS transporter